MDLAFPPLDLVASTVVPSLGFRKKTTHAGLTNFEFSPRLHHELGSDT